VIGCLFSALSVSAQTVRTNYMPGTDFSKFKTYRWGTVEAALKPNQIVDAQIKQSIETQLSAKGLTKAESESSDLVVTYQVALEKERQWNGYGTGMGPRWGGGMGTATSTTINIGTVVVDLYEPGAKQLVWQGRVSDAVDNSGNQEKTQKKIDKAMGKLFKNFPPKPKK
jgi:hypothetical protein